MPRIKGLYNTGKKNLRMSWNKYNLYNLRHKDAANSKLLDKDIGDRKLYWQMQVGKRVTRKYHGQVLQERVFKKQLYSPKFNVVAGGIGGERVMWGGLYQGIERRLDTVIFRSLFATSIQQARQMVIHGHVEVNGKKESRPGVLLQPGDIYHANPQLVKRYISSHFHAKHSKFTDAQREMRTIYRKEALRKRGENPNKTDPNRVEVALRYEYDPEKPIHVQEIHPIIKTLDRQAKMEDKRYRNHEQFIPKPWMAPNVFLPAYLEVSYRSCTGCFVRKPHIKKDGLMEIPSPFPAEIYERAGMYYTRFGRRAEKKQSGYKGYKLFWNKRKIKT